MTVESRSTSPFQWNAGAWFGSQFGCTVWLLAGSVVLYSTSPNVGFVWLGGFLLSAAMSVYRWTQRERLRAYVAYQRSLLLIGVVSFACIVMAHLAGQLPRLMWGNTSAALAAYAALLVFPSLMLRFHLREKAARGADDYGPASAN